MGCRDYTGKPYFGAHETLSRCASHVMYRSQQNYTIPTSGVPQCSGQILQFETEMAENRVITLNTGAKLPVIGLGTWQSTDAVATEGLDIPVPGNNGMIPIASFSVTDQNPSRVSGAESRL